MINALLEYAESRGLASRPGYKKKAIKWELQFDATGGSLTGIVASEKEFPAAPDLSQPEMKALGAKKGQAAHFLVAPLSHFLGWAKESDAAKQSQAEAKEQVRRGTLVEMLQQVGESSPSLAAVGQTLSLDETRDRALALIAPMKRGPSPTDVATIRLGTQFPVEEDGWHAWWDDFRASLAKEGGGKGKMVSLATGEAVTAEKTHPKLTKLTGVGLSQPFAPIVTFDKAAFESYGFGQGENAAMDAESAKAYVTALDDLLEKSVKYVWRRPKPKQKKRLEKDFVRIGGSRLVYWYVGSEEARKEVEAAFDFLGMDIGSVPPDVEPPDDDAQERIVTEARLRTALERIQTGETGAGIDKVRYCVIALSGAGGRVMVRDFIQGSVLDLAHATERWFADLSLNAWNGRSGRNPELEQILVAPLPARKTDQDYLKWVTPVGAWRQALWRAALLGTRLPATAAAKALLVHNNTVVSGDLTDAEKGPLAQGLSRRRLALVKAHLIRKGIRMTPALDPEHPSAAYHCGRLLAIYDILQRAALGDVGAGVVQRYYGGAMTNPSGVFGQLSRLAQTHLSKLEGLANYYEWLIGGAHNAMRRDGDRAASYPSSLDQDQQALFALGFWHQASFDNELRSAKITENNKERNLNVAEKKARFAELSSKPELKSIQP